MERLYGKKLPPSVPIGESWEITDRPDDVSVIQDGPFNGKDLRWLMENHAAELLGKAKSLNGRFPLLIKILDAQQDLSLQVHPPACRAASLGGEPKAEMWLVTHARQGAALYVGLRRGVTRAEFEQRVADGSVAECFHRHVVNPGDAMFLHSGRVHAIGAGNVIIEIQQNSDTTYRVFDWNRVGLDGKPRELHVEQSLASIDFDDFEPALVPADTAQSGPAQIRPLARCEHFSVEQVFLDAGGSHSLETETMHIIGVVSGELHIVSTVETRHLRAGDFCIVPACTEAKAVAASDASFLRAQAGDGIPG